MPAFLSVLRKTSAVVIASALVVATELDVTYVKA
jgi:hypothetical protein